MKSIEFPYSQNIKYHKTANNLKKAVAKAIGANVLV